MVCEHCLWLIIFGSFSNQVDGLHQKVIVKVFVEVEQKVNTDFAKGKGNDQSGDVENEVFVSFSFLPLNLHLVKGQKVRSKAVVVEGCLGVSRIFGVDELLSLFPNVVHWSIHCVPIFILILQTKNPHVSEVN